MLSYTARAESEEDLQRFRAALEDAGIELYTWAADLADGDPEFLAREVTFLSDASIDVLQRIAGDLGDGRVIVDTLTTEDD